LIDQTSQEICLNVHRIPLKDIPVDAAGIKTWLMNLFIRKDKLMSYFKKHVLIYFFVCLFVHLLVLFVFASLFWVIHTYFKKHALIYLFFIHIFIYSYIHIVTKIIISYWSITHTHTQGHFPGKTIKCYKPASKLSLNLHFLIFSAACMYILSQSSLV